MSTTLISEPQASIPIGNCAEFKIELTNPGTSALKKMAGYQIFLNGQKVTQQDEALPYTGGPEKIDVSPILKDLIKSEIPGYGVSAITTLTGAVKPFKLKYGYIDVDLQNCEQTTFINADSAEIAGIDGRFAGWHDINDLTNKPFVLSEKPGKINVAKGQRDWVCIYRQSGDIGIKVTGYDLNNTQVYYRGLTVTANKEVKAVPVGPGNSFFNFNPTIQYYDVEIYSTAVADEEISNLSLMGGTRPGVNALVWSCRFVVGSCSEIGPNDEIYFKEPLGGYSGFKLSSYTGSAAVSGNLYQLGRNCNNDLINGGRYRAGGQTFEQIQASFEQPYSDGLERYLGAFFAADEHYLKYVGPGGAVQYRRVNLIGGQAQTVTGRSPVSVVTFSVESGKSI